MFLFLKVIEHNSVMPCYSGKQYLCFRSFNKPLQLLLSFSKNVKMSNSIIIITVTNISSIKSKKNKNFRHKYNPNLKYFFTF